MKKLVFLLALVAFATTAWGEPGHTTGNMLRLRKRPNTDSVAIEAYPKGEKVDVLGWSENRKWVKVKVESDGKVGYMAAVFVSTEEPRDLPVKGEQADVAVTGFQMKSGNPSADTDALVAAGEAQADRKAKVVTLVARGGEGEAELQAKYEATLLELSTAQKEITSLKQEVSGLKDALATSERAVAEYRRRLATLEEVLDFRLMSLVEGRGEEVAFNGLGAVLMAEHNGRVIFKVPAELAEKARKLFGRANKNMFDGVECLYITIDKGHLSLESRKG